MGLSLSKKEFKTRLMERLSLATYEFALMRLFEMNGKIEFLEIKKAEIDHQLTAAECMLLNQSMSVKTILKLADEVFSELDIIYNNFWQHANRSYERRYFQEPPPIAYTEKIFQEIWIEFRPRISSIKEVFVV